MANFMTGFMQGYDFVDGKKRLDRNESRLDADRARALTREQKQDGRADELWNRQTKALDDQNEARGLQAEAYNLDTILEGVKKGDQSSILKAQELASSDTRIQAFNQNLQDPQALDQTLADIDILESGFKGKANKKDVIDSTNRVLGPWLNYGDGGENKRVVDIFPSQSGQGFYVELEMEENGKTKRAPLTNGRSAKDTEIKEIPADQLVQALMLIKQEVNTRRVALGDSAPVQARTAAQERALTRGDKVEDRNATHQLAVDLENIKQRNRVTIEGMKKEAEANGIGTKEFNTALNSLEGLLKKRVQILVGSDEFGNVMPQENIDKALAEIDSAIADREGYLTSIAPGLWEKYRPQLQDGNPEPVPGPTTLDDIFGAGASPAQEAAPAQMPQTPPPMPGSQPVGQGQGAFPNVAPQVVGQGGSLSPRVEAQVQPQSLTRERPALPINAPKNAQQQGPTDMRSPIARGLDNAKVTDPVEQKVAQVRQTPPPIGGQPMPETQEVMRFYEWTQERGVRPNVESLLAYVAENPENSQQILALFGVDGSVRGDNYAGR